MERDGNLFNCVYTSFLQYLPSRPCLAHIIQLCPNFTLSHSSVARNLHSDDEIHGIFFCMKFLRSLLLIFTCALVLRIRVFNGFHLLLLILGLVAFLENDGISELGRHLNCTVS